MISRLFSTPGRPWKILGALLLLYAGCRWSLHGRGEREAWACEGHPEALDGHVFWLFSERITAVDPATRTLEVEPHGYRIRIQASEADWPRGAEAGRRLYARFRFDKVQGFVLEDGARTAADQPLTHLHLYLVSIPALGVAAALFFSRFRMGPDGLGEKGRADA